MKRYRDLRIAFIAGSLGQGGAEKQLLYMCRTLLEMGVQVRVYSLTKGDHYESMLQDMGVCIEWVGQHSNPFLRLMALAHVLLDFRPHILQASHFYVNLYVGLLAPLIGAVDIGSIRSDVNYELEENPFWGRLLLWLPRTLIANSCRAQQNAEAKGITCGKILTLPNAIDLAAFDTCGARLPQNVCSLENNLIVIAIGRLIPAKRFDRFISALVLARRENQSLMGIIVGDGPERSRLENFALQNGLSETELVFLGKSNDIPDILKRGDIFVQTSDHEGFPNVLLEAMAARLPIITTPAGDSDMIVIHGQTGYVIPFEDIDELASHIVQIANSHQLRRELGNIGRVHVERNYDITGLAEKMLAVYSQIAVYCRSRRLAKALSL